jgi:PilZ domain
MGGIIHDIRAINRNVLQLEDPSMQLVFASNQSQKRGGTVSEARTGRRFPLELPIKIHKESEGGEHSGVTGNLSAAGVYIRADAALDVGSNVEFEITLPPEVTGAKENVVVKCQGRVVRTDEPAGAGQDSRGVACVIDSYDFVRR